MITIGSDFSGVGAFNQSLMRLGVNYKEIFACDMDKFARQTFIHNYGEPQYYPTNVYDRAIPSESLDVYMTSPPCQAFSLAGKRLGKDDKRGILFFNSHEFIQINKPRFFIFENVKGLLSDDGGRTFQEWVNMLGGKSVNGVPVLFPYEDSVPYHLYWQVLNAKHHGVPQNRERVFLIGIRDDVDNQFQFPREEHLIKRLKDVLEDEVDEKYFLTDNTINTLVNNQRFNKYKPIENMETESSCITSHCGKFGNANNYLKVTNFQGKDICNTIRTGGKGSMSDKHNWDTIKIKSATLKGYEEATLGDSINFSVPNSETRRGRVGKGVAQTLDTACNQAIMVVKNTRSDEEKQRRREHKQKTGKDSGRFKDKTLLLKQQDYYDTILSNANPQKEGLIAENYKIRRLTPRECFRLMDFPDTFTWPVSDSQAYKQAGNSIVVNVLYKILKQLPL